ncbi:MAG: response regulator [Proteobacteria bacterium]|nr:response regulator [Pseudomonadota bacterium]
MLPKDAKIMVVDDTKIIRFAMKKYLKSLGYENIIEAVDGNDAVRKHAEEKPAIIFMDVVMPGLTGDKALQQIRSQDTETPVVMLTSVADESTINECERAGIAGYIIKPITVEDGPDVLKRYLSL